MAEGVGEKDAKRLEHFASDQRRHAARLHNIRRSIVLFDVKPREPGDVVVVATAAEASEPKSLVTGDYNPGPCNAFTPLVSSRSPNNSQISPTHVSHKAKPETEIGSSSSYSI